MITLTNPVRVISSVADKLSDFLCAQRKKEIRRTTNDIIRATNEYIRDRAFITSHVCTLDTAQQIVREFELIRAHSQLVSTVSELHQVRRNMNQLRRQYGEALETIRWHITLDFKNWKAA